MSKKRTEIIIEFEEVIQAVAYQPRLNQAWCLDCGSDTQMITPEQAAAMTQVTVRAVNQRVEAGSVHFLETGDGRLWVCVNSLSEPPAISDWSASDPLVIPSDVSLNDASEDTCAPVGKEIPGGFE